jgi:hypothetical protein
MKNVKYLVLGIALLSVIGIASADITVTVQPTLAPNFSGYTPGWVGYDSNYYNAAVAYASYGLNAPVSGLTSTGDPATPGYYQLLASGAQIGTNANLATGFNSWMGVANPGTVFGSAFAAEDGNRLSFSVVVNGGGNLISIDHLSYSITSSDPSQSLNDLGDFEGSNYSVNRVGVLFNSDGSFKSLVTSGDGTQLVNEIIYIGVGDAWWPGGPSTDPENPSGFTGTGQAAINSTESWLGSQTPITVTGTYTYAQDDSRITGSANVTVVPVPAAVLLGIGGLSLVGLLKKRFAKSV